jgi:hypothetical protein
MIWYFAMEPENLTDFPDEVYGFFLIASRFF